MEARANVPNSVRHPGLQFKPVMIYRNSLIRKSKIQNTKDVKPFLEGVWMLESLWKTVFQFLAKLNKLIIVSSNHTS